jgi:hypothetical protein
MLPRIVAVVLILAGLAAAQAKPSHPAPKPPDDAVKKLEQQWLEAVGKRDQAAVDALLAADYQAIAIDGRARTRDQELAAVTDTTRPALTRFFGRLEIAASGPTFAVVRGLIVLNGERIREAHISFTHVWVLRERSWVVVAAQETLGNE